MLQIPVLSTLLAVWSVENIVKVTGKKSGKAVKKTLTSKITVKPVAIKAKAAETTVAVGTTAKDLFTVAPAGKKLAYKSSDDAVATVDANGVVTAAKAGEATITASSKYAEAPATVKVTVKTAVLKGIAQKSTTTLEATFAGDTKSLKAGDFKITNTSNNVIYAVKDVTVDAKDATKVTLTTYMEMKDAKEYTVEYDGTTQKFTATDGVVVTLGLDKTQIDAATETEIQAQAKDANGIVVGTYKYGDAKVTMTVNVTNGYMTGTKLFLNKAGDTATVDLTYHKGTYDTTGKEEVIEQKGITVTAVDPEKVTVAGWAVKVGAANSTFDKVTETKLAVGDTKTAYVQVTNSKNEKSVDLSAYTVESSNKDALILGSLDLKNGKIEVIAVKEGTSYILVKDAKTGAVVTTLAVNVVAARKASSIELDKTAVSLSKTIAEDTDVVVTVKDQYGEKVTLKDTGVETLSYKNKSGETVANTTLTTNISIGADGKANVKAVSTDAEGTYTLKMKANGLSRVLTVSVVAADTNATTSYAFEMSGSTADAVISADVDATEAKITAKVFQLNGGVKSDKVTGIEGKLYKADGTPVTTSNVGVSTSSDGVVTVKVNDFDHGDKLAAGTYKLEVKPTASNSKIPTFTRNIVVTDSQTAVTVKRVAESGSSVSSCFEFYLNGEKLTPESVSFYSGASTTPLADTAAGTVAVTKAEITYKAGAHSVKQTVNIGLTVTVK